MNLYLNTVSFYTFLVNNKHSLFAFNNEGVLCLRLFFLDKYYKETNRFVQELIDYGLFDLDKYSTLPVNLKTQNSINQDFSKIFLKEDVCMFLFVKKFVEKLSNES